MATERIHEPGTKKEVAKALRGSEKEGLVTIPIKFSFLLHLDEAKYHWQKSNSPTINYNRCHSSSWLNRYEFLPRFRNTALKEIGKIYAVQGRKFLLSFPAPYTCDQFKARGLSSWLAQSASSTQHMWELLAENTARQFSHDKRGEGGSGVTLICVLVNSIRPT